MAKSRRRSLVGGSRSLRACPLGLYLTQASSCLPLPFALASPSKDLLLQLPVLWCTQAHGVEWPWTETLNQMKSFPPKVVSFRYVVTARRKLARMQSKNEVTRIGCFLTKEYSSGSYFAGMKSWWFHWSIGPTALFFWRVPVSSVTLFWVTTEHRTCLSSSNAHCVWATRSWPQGLTHARQELYHSANPQAPEILWVQGLSTWCIKGVANYMKLKQIYFKIYFIDNFIYVHNVFWSYLFPPLPSG